jgi:hypothetical protein
MDFNQFWNTAGPGLLNLGVGLYNKNAAQKEAAGRLALAQGPLYGQAMGGAQATLGEAGNFNPDALATDRFNAGQALVAPVQQKQLADLQRMLYAKGMLGAANYNPGVEGITPNGTAMNPQLAAFYAAQNADQAKRAQAALGEGQTYANNLVSRAGNLQTIAGNAQGTGIAAQNTQPSGATSNGLLLKGVTDILTKNPGLFKTGIDWLGGLFGGGGNDTMLGGYNAGSDFVW